MRPVRVRTRACRIKLCKAKSPLARDVYMYDFSIADAMINPKYSEKNDAAANQHAHRYRDISYITASDKIAYGCSY